MKSLSMLILLKAVLILFETVLILQEAVLCLCRHSHTLEDFFSYSSFLFWTAAVAAAFGPYPRLFLAEAACDAANCFAFFFPMVGRGIPSAPWMLGTPAALLDDCAVLVKSVSTCPDASWVSSLSLLLAVASRTSMLSPVIAAGAIAPSALRSSMWINQFFGACPTNDVGNRWVETWITCWSWCKG